jgi:hypothetical protein
MQKYMHGPAIPLLISQKSALVYRCNTWSRVTCKCLTHVIFRLDSSHLWNSLRITKFPVGGASRSNIMTPSFHPVLYGSGCQMYDPWYELGNTNIMLKDTIYVLSFMRISTGFTHKNNWYLVITHNKLLNVDDSMIITAQGIFNGRKIEAELGHLFVRAYIYIW